MTAKPVETPPLFTNMGDETKLNELVLDLED